MDNFFSIVVFSAFLLLASALLMTSHVRAWKRHQSEDLDVEEFNFRRRQFRRRMQTSAMIGLLAIAIAVGHIVAVWIGSKWFALAYLLLTLLVVCWVCLLALADIWATKLHYGSLHHRNFLEQTKLRARIKRLEAGKKNGHSREIPLPGIDPDAGTENGS